MMKGLKVHRTCTIKGIMYELFPLFTRQLWLEFLYQRVGVFLALAVILCRGHYREHSYEIILVLDPWFIRCCLKIFFFTNDRQCMTDPSQ